MERTITVKGTGRISVPPDCVELGLKLDTLDPDYTRMQEKAAARLDLLHTAAVQLGFDDKALKTTSYHITIEKKSRYDRENTDQETFLGYKCCHELKLTFDFEPNRLAQVLTALGQCSAKPELTIAFTVKDPDAVKAELLRAAAANARQKARILTEASGVELGQLLSIQYDWAEVQFASFTSLLEGAHGAAPRGLMMSRQVVPEDIDVSDSAAFIWAIQ